MKKMFNAKNVEKKKGGPDETQVVWKAAGQLVLSYACRANHPHRIVSVKGLKIERNGVIWIEKNNGNYDRLGTHHTIEIYRRSPEIGLVLITKIDQRASEIVVRNQKQVHGRYFDDDVERFMVYYSRPSARDL
ncbi:hypothetical protein IKW75_02300 [Candidatus Saccharibacteria bacterium]|nr:hypothetical protein [Candidatus Saccharibacteria bacterium]